VFTSSVKKRLSIFEKSGLLVVQLCCADAGWLCCGGVFERHNHRLLELALRRVNLDGWVVSLQRRADTVSYDDVPVASCDRTARNGLVHSINAFVPGAIRRYANAPRPHSRWTGTAGTLQTLLTFLRL